MVQQINVQLKPSKPEDARLNLSIGPAALIEQGFVMPIIVQTPSVLTSPPISKPLKAILVMALLDTGAQRTCISDKLAEQLNLEVIGFSEIRTAGGVSTFPDYIVDIQFPNASLQSFNNLNIGSCKLPYGETNNQEQQMNHANFGALIGRDIMSKWSIFWNGPTSSVFISD